MIQEQRESSDDKKNPDEIADLIFVEQTIGNACGTIALLHACCNTLDQVGGVKEESFLERFMHEPQTPAERAKFLTEDEKFEKTHDAMA